MKLLILGGTRFLGRHLVAAAQAREDTDVIGINIGLLTKKAAAHSTTEDSP